MVAAIVVYASVVLVQWYGCFKKDSRIKGITKPFLMPLLFVIVLASKQSISLLALLGLLFGWLGDILLKVDDNDTALIAGIGAFGLGHIFYTIVLFGYITNYQILHWMIALAICVVFAGLVYGRLRVHLPRKMKVPVIFYIIIILSMAFFAMLRIMDQVTLGSILSLVGAVFFVVSDSFLAFDLFAKPERSKDLTIMFFYVLAQTLLIASFIV